MSFGFKTSHLVSSISVMTVAAGLAFGPLTTQKSVAQTTLNGAGSTFVAPLLTALDQANSSITINYAGGGSGAGRTAFLTQSPAVDFAASDSPLSASQRTVTGSPNQGPAVQVPITTGAISLAFNPAGLSVPSSGLRLSRRSYCGILNGAITNWNDPAITTDNGRRVAANLPIRVVRRSDSSGTTFNLTNHLTTVCKGFTPSSFNWSRGAGQTVNWPSTFLSTQGGSGVVKLVASTRGAIGYADESNRLSAGRTTTARALLANQSGNYVAPTAAAASAAFTGAVDIDPSPTIITLGGPSNNPNLLLNPPAAQAYPIVGPSYLLAYDVYSSAGVAAAVRSLVSGAFSTSGDSIATNLGYAPLPESLQTAALKVINTYVDVSAN